MFVIVTIVIVIICVVFVICLLSCYLSFVRLPFSPDFSPPNVTYERSRVNSHVTLKLLHFLCIYI